MSEVHLKDIKRREFLRGCAVGMVLLLEARPCSEGTGLKGQRVTHIAELLGKAMRLPADRLRNLRYGAALHDVGKETIEDSVLNKPGALTADERSRMQTHAEAGFEIILAAGFPAPVALVAAQHHEWWNGSGYPNHLARLSICIEARILTVADAYEAMTTDRVYRPKRSHHEAVAELERCAGTQFDPDVVKAFSLLDEADVTETAEASLWH